MAWDLFTSTPEMKVMKWGWVLVTLYTGPVGLLIYWFPCRESAPGTHELFIAPLWKQAVGSTIHCAAGDATGIIVAAGITGFFGLRMGVDIWVEYAAGFAFGLLIFQALFMKDMMGVSYGKAVRDTFLPEWMSMNAMMAGMLPTMVILMTRDMRAMEATSPWFWASMSTATLVGVAVAYPVNYWLVKNKLTHGVGTERALGKGGALLEEADGSAVPAGRHLAMAGMDHSQPAAAVPIEHSAHARHAIPAMQMADADPQATRMPDTALPGVQVGSHAMAGMDMSGDNNVSGLRKAAVTLLTLLMLAASYALAARYGDLSMAPGQKMMPMPGVPGMPMHRMQEWFDWCVVAGVGLLPNICLLNQYRLGCGVRTGGVLVTLGKIQSTDRGKTGGNN